MDSGQYSTSLPLPPEHSHNQNASMSRGPVLRDLSAEHLNRGLSRSKHETPVSTSFRNLRQDSRPAQLYEALGHTLSRTSIRPTVPPETYTYPLRGPPAPRRPLLEPPNRLQVYYMPSGRYIPKTSVIHDQKRQDGFFCHPMLAMGMSRDGQYAYVYALTRIPPPAIKDLMMCLRIGTSTVEEGPGVLRLAKGSDKMQYETWVNLEQLFQIEWRYLDYWAANVIIDDEESAKLSNKVIHLEALQNRYIYKPLWRDLSGVSPGTVLMMLNDPLTSHTLGAPVLVLINQYPRIAFLRIKLFGDNANFNINGIGKCTTPRRLCLRIGRGWERGHDDTPILLLEPISPDMREPSYVEVNWKPRWCNLDKLKTWSFPHVRLQLAAMRALSEYMDTLPRPGYKPQARGHSTPNTLAPHIPFVQRGRRTIEDAPSTFPPPATHPANRHNFNNENADPRMSGFYSHPDGILRPYPPNAGGFEPFTPPHTPMPAYSLEWGFSHADPGQMMPPPPEQFNYPTNLRPNPIMDFCNGRPHPEPRTEPYHGGQVCGWVPTQNILFGPPGQP